MNKTILIFSLIIWLVTLSILIIALTNIWPNETLYNYRLVIGIIFFITTGFLKFTYNKFYKSQQGAIS